MKTFVVCIACVVAAGLAADARQGSAGTRAVVTSYLEIQEHLAADRLDETRAPARALARDAGALGASAKEIARAAAAVETAASIDAAREAFGGLSDAVIARVKAEEASGAAPDLRLAYCPMARRAWLQRGEAIRNPYYGAQMLTCGEIRPLGK